MTKEEIHDTEISPLMDKIIAICKEHQIPIHASFDLGDETFCNTHIEKGGNTLNMKLMYCAALMQDNNFDQFMLGVLKLTRGLPHSSVFLGVLEGMVV